MGSYQLLVQIYCPQIRSPLASEESFTLTTKKIIALSGFCLVCPPNAELYRSDVEGDRKFHS